MRSFHVIVLAQAERDVGSIIAWLAKRSPLGAARWDAALRNAMEKLAEKSSFV